MKEGKAPLGGDAYGKFRQRQKLAKIVYHVCQTLEENGQASLTVTFCALPALSHQTLFSLCAGQARGRRSFFFFLSNRALPSSTNSYYTELIIKKEKYSYPKSLSNP